MVGEKKIILHARAQHSDTGQRDARRGDGCTLRRSVSDASKEDDGTPRSTRGGKSRTTVGPPKKTIGDGAHWR